MKADTTSAHQRKGQCAGGLTARGWGLEFSMKITAWGMKASPTESGSEHGRQSKVAEKQQNEQAAK